MLSPRLLTVASLIEKNSIVLDVGTDHAYLPIYLINNNICKKVYASDISEGALEIAKKNIEKNNIKSIKLIHTDGLKDIKEKYDTLVICGMGTSTIINILKSGTLPNRIILSSHNDLYSLRQYLNSIDYRIKEEKVVLDNQKYYCIISYEKGNEKLSKKTLKYGKSNNKDYYKHLYKVQKDIFNKMNFINKIKSINKLIELKILSI